MKAMPIGIALYNKMEKATSTIYVEQVGDNKFKMLENALVDCSLTLGTEFEAKINKEGSYEIVRITKRSDFLTRRFFLSAEYTESDYRVLGKELTERGGFWQVDMGRIATINIPKEFEYDVDEVLKDLGLNIREIIDEKQDRK